MLKVALQFVNKVPHDAVRGALKCAVQLRLSIENFCLFVCFIYSRLSNFSAIRRLSPLPVTGLQI
jgi:hypothetical protein